MKLKHSHSLTALLLALSWAAGADLLVLEGNENLSGRLVRVRDGSLIFRTSLQGQMVVPMEHVQALSTDENYVLTFQDESVRYGKFVTADGKTVLQPIEGGAPVPIALKDVREATVVPRSDTGSEDAALRLHTGLGVQARTGKDDAAEPFAEIGIRRSMDGQVLEGNLALERADADEFPAWLRGRLEWRSAREGIGPFASLEVLRDQDNALRLRGDATLGAGRVLDAWSNSGEDELYGLLGVNLEYEDWKSSLNGERQEETELGVRLGLRYAKKLFQDGEISTSLDLIPSLSHFGDFRAGAATAFTMPLTEQLRLRLHLLIEYDEERALREVDHWNSTVGASVQLDF